MRSILSYIYFEHNSPILKSQKINVIDQFKDKVTLCYLDGLIRMYLPFWTGSTWKAIIGRHTNFKPSRCSQNRIAKIQSQTKESQRGGWNGWIGCMGILKKYLHFRRLIFIFPFLASGVRRLAHIRCPDVPTTDLPKVKPEKEEDKIAELAVSEYRHPKHLNFRRLIILLPASDNLTSVSGVINYLCLTFFFRILSSSSHLYLVISFLFST